jgi:hypothetical protein
MPYVNTYIEVDDVLDELSDDELIDELTRRGKDYNTQFVNGDKMKEVLQSLYEKHKMKEVLQSLYEKRRIGKDYQSELDQLIYGILGKVI